MIRLDFHLTSFWQLQTSRFPPVVPTHSQTSLLRKPASQWPPSSCNYRDPIQPGGEGGAEGRHIDTTAEATTGSVHVAGDGLGRQGGQRRLQGQRTLCEINKNINWAGKYFSLFEVSLITWMTLPPFFQLLTAPAKGAVVLLHFLLSWFTNWDSPRSSISSVLWFSVRPADVMPRPDFQDEKENAATFIIRCLLLWSQWKVTNLHRIHGRIPTKTYHHL